MMEKEYFGTTAAGEKVHRFRLKNRSGTEVVLLEYGAVIQSLKVPGRDGLVDVVLGYDHLADYESSDNMMGALVGRVANRIEGASFVLGERKYTLEANDGENHIHGTFPHRVFRGKEEGDTLVLSLLSPPEEEGYPGNLSVEYRVSLQENGSLLTEIRQKSDQDTITNLTHHDYYNLNGYTAPEASCLGHFLMLPQESFLEANMPSPCPTGRVLPVAETVMDFREKRVLGERMEHPSLCGKENVYGYDHCYVTDPEAKGELKTAAVLQGEISGIRLRIETTEPGLQLYTGNYLDEGNRKTKGGVPLTRYAGLALETQHFPCTPSHPNFPSLLLPAGEERRSVTRLTFDLTEK